MKKQYKKPIIGVVNLEIFDVITTSGFDGGPKRMGASPRKSMTQGIANPSENEGWTGFIPTLVD